MVPCQAGHLVGLPMLSCCFATFSVTVLAPLLLSATSSQDFPFTIVFFFCFCPQPCLHSWPLWLPSSALPRYAGLFLQVREQTVCRARCPVGALPHLGSFHHCPESLFPFLAVESPSLPSLSLPFPSYPILFLLSLLFLLSWAFMAFPLSEFAKRKAPLITEVLVGVAGLAACSCCR